MLEDWVDGLSSDSEFCKRHAGLCLTFKLSAVSNTLPAARSTGHARTGRSYLDPIFCRTKTGKFASFA